MLQWLKELNSVMLQLVVVMSIVGIVYWERHYAEHVYLVAYTAEGGITGNVSARCRGIINEDCGAAIQADIKRKYITTGEIVILNIIELQE